MIALHMHGADYLYLPLIYNITTPTYIVLYFPATKEAQVELS